MALAEFMQKIKWNSKLETDEVKADAEGEKDTISNLPAEKSYFYDWCVGS